EKMKSRDMIDSLLAEFSNNFPRLKKRLIDERDQYLAEKIKRAPGKKIVAVLGAAHVPGITTEIRKDHDLQRLTKIPPKSKMPKIIGWPIPIIILDIIAHTFFSHASAGYQQTMSWIIWNVSFSAIGAAAAFGHPLSIVTAFIAAPITSLNPLLAAGWFAGFVQAYIRRPNVRDFETLSEDVYTAKGFWNNKVTRILLII